MSLQGAFTCSIFIPEGATAGTKLQHRTPDGQELDLTVPEGCPPGARLILSQDPSTGRWSCMVDPGRPQGPLESGASPSTFSLVVPATAMPGSTLTHRMPDGRELDITVPEGVLPGSTLVFTQDPSTKAWSCTAGPAVPAERTGSLAGPLRTSVVVPPGAAPGSSVPFRTPDGRELDLTVPDGVPPGSVLMLTLDPITQSWKCTVESLGPPNPAAPLPQFGGMDPATLRWGCAAEPGPVGPAVGSRGAFQEAAARIAVVVPPGYPPGSTLQHRTPDGRELDLTVPEGVPAGSTLILTQDPITKAWSCSAEPATPESASAWAAAEASITPPPAASKISVVVPPNAVPGSSIPFWTPDGRELDLTVPEGVPAGSVLSLMLDAATQSWRCTVESLGPTPSTAAWPQAAARVATSDFLPPPTFDPGSPSRDQMQLPDVAAFLPAGQLPCGGWDGGPASPLAHAEPAPPRGWASYSAGSGLPAAGSSTQFPTPRAMPAALSPLGEYCASGEPRAPVAPPSPSGAVEPEQALPTLLAEPPVPPQALPSRFGASQEQATQLEQTSFETAFDQGLTARASPPRGRPSGPPPVHPWAAGMHESLGQGPCGWGHLGGPMPPAAGDQEPAQAPAAAADSPQRRSSEQATTPGALITVWYCGLHNTSEKRPKRDGGRVWHCRGCNVEVSTNYREFAFCQPCSDREKKCMVCGSEARTFSSQMTVRPREPDPPLQASSIPPRYCLMHGTSEKRKKVTTPKFWDCMSCGRKVSTNYTNFTLCPPCSERDMRCMICGSSAPEAGNYVPPATLTAPSLNLTGNGKPEDVPQEPAPYVLPPQGAWAGLGTTSAAPAAWEAWGPTGTPPPDAFGPPPRGAAQQVLSYIPPPVVQQEAKNGSYVPPPDAWANAEHSSQSYTPLPLPSLDRSTSLTPLPGMEDTVINAMPLVLPLGTPNMMQGGTGPSMEQSRPGVPGFTGQQPGRPPYMPPGFGAPMNQRSFAPPPEAQGMRPRGSTAAAPSLGTQDCSINTRPPPNQPTVNPFMVGPQGSPLNGRPPSLNQPGMPPFFMGPQDSMRQGPPMPGHMQFGGLPPLGQLPGQLPPLGMGRQGFQPLDALMPPWPPGPGAPPMQVGLHLPGGLYGGM